ncbi:MAG: LacI family transcriptional regulator [Cupriavidus sp.]|nr:MAG: LacI family transcriptional regulator [Cupriavidus sp.]
MPNQRAIAAEAGVTQAAVSKALRGDRSIPEATRLRIAEVARKLGYRPNAYVATLMAHIRSGRPLVDKGCIALLVDASSDKHWMGDIGGYSYRLQYQGVLERARALGFTTECFFLRGGGASQRPDRIDRILRARGINGLILMPTMQHALGLVGDLTLSWEHYAAATIAYTWSNLPIDRVSSHHRHNLDIAIAELHRRGYSRVGMCLPPEAMNGVDYSWRERFLLWQDRLPPRRRIPLFVGKPEVTALEKFRKWLAKWKPDALVGLIGHEKDWLDELGLRTPEDLGYACINRPPDSRFSGVEENQKVIGAAVMDAVAAQIQRNEFGLPSHPKLILIEGTWVNGNTLRAVTSS